MVDLYVLCTRLAAAVEMGLCGRWLPWDQGCAMKVLC